MCQFFSLCSAGDGKPLYFDWILRQKCLKKELDYEPDSHTSIADYFGHKGRDEDKLNKYEYNPLTRKFRVDQVNTKDDKKKIESFCKKLDFKTIVPQLKILPIVHPFEDIKEVKKVSRQDILLLKQWDSVRASVWDSVWDSVRASVGDSVGDSVWDSVWASVRDSVRASVRASVWAYSSQYFDIKEWKYVDKKFGEKPYQCLIDLWNKGLVPSFDGKTYRLHTGKKAKIVYEITQEKLKEVL